MCAVVADWAIKHAISSQNVLWPGLAKKNYVTLHDEGLKNKITYQNEVPIALYNGLPVVLSQATVVSLWLVIPTAEGGN